MMKIDIIFISNNRGICKKPKSAVFATVGCQYEIFILALYALIAV